MPIYTVVNTKGGVGKTTISVHLAAHLATLGSALLIDSDPQASAASWAAWRRENPRLSPTPVTTCLTGKAVLSEGKGLSSGFDNVVIDAGGRDNAGMRSSLLLADRAIIPVGASNLDAAAMTDLINVIRLSRDYNPSLKFAVLLNRVDPRTRDTSEMIGWIKEQGLSIYNSHISERVSFKRSIGEGSTVFEFGKDNSAIAEINNFIEEALQ